MILHLGMSRRQGLPQPHMLERLMVATGFSSFSFLSSVGSFSILCKELRGFVLELWFASLQCSSCPIVFSFCRRWVLCCFVSSMWFLKEMRLKLLLPLSFSPTIAFEPVEQLLTNITARHKSQMHQVPAHLIKAHKENLITRQSWRKPGFCSSTKTSS